MNTTVINILISLFLLAIAYYINSPKAMWMRVRYHQWQVSEWTLFIFFFFSIYESLWFISLQDQSQPLLTLFVGIGTLAGFIMTGICALVARIDRMLWIKAQQLGPNGKRELQHKK